MFVSNNLKQQYMNEKLMDYALAYAKRGFSTIPVDANKQPAIFSWNKYQTRPMLEFEIMEHFNKKNVHGIALLTGGVNKITAIDFDLKYDLTEDLFNQYKRKIPVKLLKKMRVHKTINDGFHFVFQCDTIEGNQKLAQRETSDAELKVNLKEALGEGKGLREAMEITLRDKIRVLIETRGGEATKSGGYVVIPPSKGYSNVAGTLQKITPEEYDILLSAAREFNTYVTPNRKLARDQAGMSKNGNSPFDNFNEKGNVLSILLQNGWSEVRQYNSDVRLKRPGQTHSKSSALYDTNTMLLNVFTTSSVFDVGYHTPSDVFIMLECNADVKLAYKRLIELGYTDDRNKK